MERRTTNYIGDLKVELTSDVYQGQALDTKVEVISGTVLCSIAGAEKDEFIAAINEVIDRYRI